MRKKTKKTTHGTDRFYDIFVGEYMEFVTRQFTTTMMIDEDGVQTSQETPMTVRGYLLDYDENTYYLGNTPLAVSHAFCRDDYFVATITDPEGFSMDELELPKVPKEELN